ncbi:MAG: LysR family transcriptional regulator, partial [Acutalibacteraceae bacterium]|nr:LysR family transcriptional regulator [Acutalibacteraceae bacterium]
MEANMKYVYQLYLDRSFSKAAEHLYMTQPALSIAIKRVEAELGAELFDRSRHPLELTQAGEAYIATIRQIRHLEEELQREVDDLKQLGHGTLRLGGTHYINNYI